MTQGSKNETQVANVAKAVNTTKPQNMADKAESEQEKRAKAAEMNASVLDHSAQKHKADAEAADRKAKEAAMKVKELNEKERMKNINKTN